MLRSVGKQSGESVESLLVKKKKKKKNVTMEGFAENEGLNRGMRDVCDAVSWAMAFVLLMVVQSHIHTTASSVAIMSLYIERLLGFSAVGPAGLSPMNCYTVLPCFHLRTGTVRYARPIIYMYAYIVSQKFVHSWGFLKNFPPTAESFKLKF